MQTFIAQKDEWCFLCDNYIPKGQNIGVNDYGDAICQDCLDHIVEDENDPSDVPEEDRRQEQLF